MSDETTALDFTAIYTVPDLAAILGNATTNYFSYEETSIGVRVLQL